MVSYSACTCVKMILEDQLDLREEIHEKAAIKRLCEIIESYSRKALFVNFRSLVPRPILTLLLHLTVDHFRLKGG
jgi:hypothetical protein